MVSGPAGKKTPDILQPTWENKSTLWSSVFGPGPDLGMSIKGIWGINPYMKGRDPLIIYVSLLFLSLLFLSLFFSPNKKIIFKGLVIWWNDKDDTWDAKTLGFSPASAPSFSFLLTHKLGGRLRLKWLSPCHKQGLCRVSLTQIKRYRLSSLLLASACPSSSSCRHLRR